MPGAARLLRGGHGLAQRRKSFRRIWLLLLVGAGGCVRPAAIPGTQPADNGGLSADALAVYRVVLDTLYHNLGERPPVIYMFDSTQLRMDACAKWPCTIHTQTASVDSQTIKAYERLPQTRLALPHDFQFHIPVVFLSERDSAGWTPFWANFRDTYPGAWGVAQVSRVAFDEQHAEALVQVANACPYCGSIEIMLLKKVNGNWAVAERMLQSGSDYIDILKRYVSADGYSLDSATFGSLRYVGPNAHYLADFRRQRDSTLRARLDSIALDAAPRRIRGTIANMKVAQAIPFAQLFVRSAQPYPNGTVSRIVADKFGRYEVRNPPIGGTMLEVQCPGRGHEDGRTLDAPGLYVHPAIDTTIDLRAPDIAPCWKSRGLHELSSGWVESVEATTATTPSPDEARIYEAVINDFRATLVRGRIAAIFSHTVNRCDDSERCGSVQLARLDRERVVDSMIIRDFNSKTKNPVPINPRFAAAMGLHVVTSDEIQFLAKESEPFSEPTRYPRDDSARFWTAFKKIHGDRQGILSVTRIGFDHSKSRALVEAGVNFGMPRWDNPLRMFLLRKTNDVWRIEMRDVGDAVTSGEWDGARCVPVKPPSNLSRYSVATLQGDFDVLLVPTVGSTRPNRVRLRLSSPWNDRLGTPPKNSFYPNDPSLEVIDEKTGKPDEKRVLDFSLVGPGVTFRQATKWLRLDGYTQAMQIRRVDSTGFFGSWSAGVFAPSEFGHFCARRVPPH